MRERPDSPVEAEYRKTVEKVLPQIQECCKMAAQAYADAVRLADAHSIPFRTSVLGRSHTYKPVIVTGKLNHDIVGHVTSTRYDSESTTGWTNSSTNC